MKQQNSNYRKTKNVIESQELKHPNLQLFTENNKGFISGIIKEQFRFSYKENEQEMYSSLVEILRNNSTDCDYVRIFVSKDMLTNECLCEQVITKKVEVTGYLKAFNSVGIFNKDYTYFSLVASKINIYFKSPHLEEELNSNLVDLQGFITKAPRLELTSKGATVAYFILKVEYNNKDVFVYCSAFHKTATEIAALHLGDKIRIIGRFHSFKDMQESLEISIFYYKPLILKKYAISALNPANKVIFELKNQDAKYPEHTKPNNKCLVSGVLESEFKYYDSEHYISKVKVVDSNNKIDYVQILIDCDTFDSINAHSKSAIGLPVEITGCLCSLKNDTIALYGKKVEIIQNTPNKNFIMLEGSVIKKPHLGITNYGVTISTLLISIEFDSEEHTIPCTCFQSLAKYCANYKEGTRVRVFGRIHSRKYKKEKLSIDTYEVVAFHIDII